MECGRGVKYGLPHNSHWDIVAPRVAPVNVTSLFLKASRLRRKVVLVLTDAFPFQTVSELAACSCGPTWDFSGKCSGGGEKIHLSPFPFQFGPPIKQGYPLDLSI